jgi:fructose-bisphosphate aldolase class I
MSRTALGAIAQAMVADGKGLLAIDESNPTCNRRFAALGIPQTEDARRAWRDVILTTPGLAQSISGVILYDETVRQSDPAGTPFLAIIAQAGIMPGIKVDIGLTDLAGHPREQATEGLDGLRQRLAAYAAMGARFAKWRTVFALGTGLPTRAAIETNAHALARYAALCQEAGLVPVVEPEVLMAGSHDLARCAAVTETVLRAVFAHASDQGVMLEGMVLKTNMVLPGIDCPVQDGVDDVARATLTCLLRAVPAAVPAVLFLSGGQSALQATARLAALNDQADGIAPWPLSFSFARAIQQPALEIWHGDAAQVSAAQAVLAHRAGCNRAARRGDYVAATDCGK